MPFVDDAMKQRVNKKITRVDQNECHASVIVG